MNQRVLEQIRLGKNRNPSVRQIQNDSQLSLKCIQLYQNMYIRGITS